MNADRAQLLDTFEQQVTTLTCDVIVDPSPSAVAEAIDRLAAALTDAGFADAAARLAALRGEDAASVGARLEAEWQAWRADDEIKDDVGALQGDAELAGMFTAEALDHLGTIEATLLKLEETPDDRTLINDVFRPFHTIKGNAGALGLVTVQHFAHTVETLLDRCRSGAHPVGTTEIDVVLKAVDLMTALITDIATRATGGEGRALRTERIALVSRVEALIVSGGEAPSAKAPAAPVAPDAAIPLGTAPAPSTPAASAAPASSVPSASSVASAASKDSRDAQAAVKVDTRKLDGLVDTVGELVILQSLIYEHPSLRAIADEKLTRNLAQLRRITTELQRSAMSMRTVPIRQTFQKMSRLVRDLSKRSGKPIELTLAGEDTELDRKIVEDVNDPLMHMIRNSVDHGIEPPDARAAAGKRATGRLSLRAFHQGGAIVIEIADDGAGLNTERIRQKALKQGIIAASDELSVDEINMLIFKPGFSTAEQITEISGRGVGMDVVKRNVEALRGRIDIQTQPGEGTTFSVRLPLTLAILDGLLIGVGRERFVVPTFAIRESLRPTPAQVHTINGEPRMILVRDRLLPLVWLADLFAASEPRVPIAESTVVVIEDDHRAVGLVADRLIGKQEVVVKSLGDTFAGVTGVAGGAILGDGRIGLILDAHGITALIDAGGMQDAA
jgi:two-component system chemotaxis sensor kinase CheA